MSFNFRVHLIGLLLTCASLCSAQLANRPPVPDWLQGEVLRRDFQVPEHLLMAILLVAGEAEVTVKINQHPVATLPASTTAVSLDVTRHLRAGANAIELSSTGKTAALLEINGDLAKKTWLGTDPHWGADRVLGPTNAVPDADPFDLKKTHDAYNSWKLAARGAQSQATDPASLQVPLGYQIQLIHSATTDQDSWISLAFDPLGRIVLGREKKGLLRLNLSQIEPPEITHTQVIDDSLEECRGLLFAHGWLYAHANRSKTLYRLRDPNDDGVFETKEVLLTTGGSYGHGRNHLKLGPDGRIWMVQGNNVHLPDRIAPDSPLRHYANDQLLPNPWDHSMFDGDVELPAGHILSMNPDGSDVRLIAGGLRNPLDMAFNRQGDLFTFDADMERDIGAPWYMPTRVLHVVPGADFGWRRGTGRWPAYYADTLPSVIDIGLSSPTAVFFGYGARFPAKDQEALFVCDWSYGRIIAVRLRPSGSSYTASQENFVTGRPLNVTDGTIGPDGALWFITGGRGTQSGLYRVVHAQAADLQPVERLDDSADPEDKPHHAARQQRLQLTQTPNPAQVQAGLASEDAFVRHAARIAIESSLPQSVGPASVLPAALLARARVGSDEERDEVIEILLREPFSEPLVRLRILEIAIARRAAPLAEEVRSRLRTLLDPLYPSANDSALNHQLCKHLIYLRSTSVLAKTTELLASATRSEDLLYYPFLLRYLRDDPGWTESHYRIVFTALNQAEKKNGASTYFKAIADTRAELAAALPPVLASRLAAFIAPAQPPALTPHALPSHTFKNWTLADLEPQLPKVASGRSYEGAKKALISAQCVFCHRVGAGNELPAGLFGPDLTQVSARFGRRDLLDHILNPSKVIDEKFRFLTLTQHNGNETTGTLESEDDERLVLKPNPLAAETVEIGKSTIIKRADSPHSPMPAGLLNGLKSDQILDLLAWFEALGNPEHPAFALPGASSQ